MKITPVDALNDLEQYLINNKMDISEDARSIFFEMEKIAESVNSRPLHQDFLLACIRTMPKFRQAITYYGGDCSAADAMLYEHILKEIDEMDTYGRDCHPYTNPEYEDVATRPILLKKALYNAKKRFRTVLIGKDILEALLAEHDSSYPLWENGDWVDETLHVPFNTLCHICGFFHPSLWIKFEDIRSFMGLHSINVEEELLRKAPLKLRDSLTSFLTDNPKYNKNCFLIMSFAGTKFHQEILLELKAILQEYGLNLLRADDQGYADDVLTNIETYIYGCGTAIAVFERIQGEIYNPNVSFEVGYMAGLNKPICYLKEKTLPKLQSDLVSKLYVEFDVSNIAESLRAGIYKWLKDKKLV